MTFYANLSKNIKLISIPSGMHWPKDRNNPMKMKKNKWKRLYLKKLEFLNLEYSQACYFVASEQVSCFIKSHI